MEKVPIKTEDIELKFLRGRKKEEIISILSQRRGDKGEVEKEGEREREDSFGCLLWNHFDLPEYFFKEIIEFQEEIDQEK